MKKLARVLLWILMLGSLFAVPAFADSGNAESTDAVEAWDHILLGNYDGGPVDWIVLDNEEMNDGNPGFFLFAKYVVQESGVMYDYGYADWPGSVAQSCCTDFYNAAFTDLEKTVIPAVNVTEERSELYDLYWRPADLVNECVFYISAPELAKYYGPYDGADGLTATAPDGHIVYYWLRSPHGYHSDYSGIVYENGSVHDHLVYISWGGRPATNLCLDNVLYVTAYSTEEDGTTLWKAAVVDESIDFQVTGCVLKDNLLEVFWSSSASGTGYDLGLLIYDADGKVVGNADLGALKDSTGSVDLNLSDYDIPDGGTIAFYALSSDEASAIDIVSRPAEVHCAISFTAGEGSGSMDVVYAVPGTALSLPDCSFIPQEHKKFDHWEQNGEPVENGTIVTDNMELTAVYSDIMVDSIQLSEEALAVNLGETVTVTASTEPLDAANRNVSWKTDKAGVIKVTANEDGSCTVKAKRTGSANLICTSQDGGAEVSVPVTVKGSALKSFFSNIEGILTGLALIAGIAALLLIRRKKQHPDAAEGTEEYIREFADELTQKTALDEPLQADDKDNLRKATKEPEQEHGEELKAEPVTGAVMKPTEESTRIPDAENVQQPVRKKAPSESVEKAVKAIRKKRMYVLIPLLVCGVLLAVFSVTASFRGAASENAAEPTPEATAEITPEPVVFVEPEMKEGTPVFINGGNPSRGSFMKDGVLYVKLSDAAELLDISVEYDADSGQYILPWRNSGAILTPDSDSVFYLDETRALDAEMLPCDQGTDLYIPVESFCRALQIGILNDEENSTLYCTPGAGDWELPAGYTVPVFMYHGTGSADEGSNLIVSGTELEKQLQYLTENGYTTIWFEDLWNVENIEKPVILTFDDGWRNNYSTLYPLLQQYNCKATIFVVTDFIDRSNNHLTSYQVIEMSDSPYVSIQSHTVSHNDLDSMSADDQAYQMEQSRLLITRMTGKEPMALAYPEGGATSVTQEVLLQYYRFGCRMYSPVCYNTSDDPSWIYRLYVGRETQINEYINNLTNGIAAADSKYQTAEAQTTEVQTTE